MGTPYHGLVKDDGTLGMNDDGTVTLFDAEGVTCCCNTEPEYPCPDFACDCSGLKPETSWEGILPSPETNFDPYKAIGPVCSNLQEFVDIDFWLLSSAAIIQPTQRLLHLNATRLIPFGPSASGAGVGGFVNINTNTLQINGTGIAGFVDYEEYPIKISIRERINFRYDCAGYQLLVDTLLNDNVIGSTTMNFSGGPACYQEFKVRGAHTGPGTPEWAVKMAIHAH